MLSQSKKDKLNSSTKADKSSKIRNEHSKGEAPVTSRKSLKQLQQMKRRAAAEMSEGHQSDTTRTGGFESRMRVASGKGYSE
jgi:hypothetical protein